MGPLHRELLAFRVKYAHLKYAEVSVSQLVPFRCTCILTFNMLTRLPKNLYKRWSITLKTQQVKALFCIHLNTASLAIRVAIRWKILVNCGKISEMLETYQDFCSNISGIFFLSFRKFTENFQIFQPFATLLAMMISSLMGPFLLYNMAM